MFVFKRFDSAKHSKRIFNLCIIYKVKGKATTTLFKKSRLVIQAYNNTGKEVILTQSLTI